MRVAIKQEIEGIEAFDECEKNYKNDMLKWIDSGAELYRLQKPAIPPKYLVSYFVVIDGDEETYDFDSEEFSAIKWFHYKGILLDKSDPHMGRFLQKYYQNRD